MIETVRGPIGPDTLGVTLMHEHVFVTDPEVVANYGREWWDEDARVADAAAKLDAARAAGISTIVDMTVLGIGRDVRLLRRVNALVDLNIVAATGIYTFGDLPRLFRNEGPGTVVGGPEPMTEAFLTDIREGIAGTGVRAGALKCVWETPQLSASALRAQRAVCAAQRASGVPITVHTSAADRTGTPALDLYEAEGVDLTRVIVGHAGDSSDVDYLRGLMDRGAVVGCDRFGLDTYASTENRVRIVARLCALGYAEHIVLSQDSAAFTESWARPAAQEALNAHLPDWHYTFVVGSVLDRLRALGVTDAQIDTMMVANPKRLLTGAD